MTATISTKHVIITGRVQGVWYRAWVLNTAQEMGLVGWVRNRKHGEVEAVFQGKSQAVEDMIAKCWLGSDHAEVSDISLQPCEPISIDHFEIRPTE